MRWVNTRSAAGLSAASVVRCIGVRTALGSVAAMRVDAVADVCCAQNSCIAQCVALDDDVAPSPISNATSVGAASLPTARETMS